MGVEWGSGQDRHRRSVRFIRFPPNKKSLTPLKGARTENYFCGTTLLAAFTAARHGANTPLPYNAGIASEDTKAHARSPRPQRPICGIASSLRSQHPELSVDACAALLPHRRFNICYGYLTPNVYVCQELFFAADGQAAGGLSDDRLPCRGGFSSLPHPAFFVRC